MFGAVIMCLLNYSLPALVVLLVCFVFYLKQRARYFEDRGIPGPKPPSLFLGHLREKERDGKWFVRYVDWEEQFGKTFGIFEGGHRVIVTSDLDILDDVFNKQFEKFHSRKIEASFAADQATINFVNLFFSEGARWKRLRALIAGVFSAGKVRSTEGITNDSIGATIQEIEKDFEKSKIVDLKPHFLQMSLDVIERVAMGQKRTLIGSGIADDYSAHLFTLFRDAGVTTSWIRSLLAGIYEFRQISEFLFFASAVLSPNLREFNRLGAKLKKVYDQKVKEGGKREQKDFVDYMIESQIEESEIQDYGKTITDRKVQKNLTAGEIISAMTMFLVAGYDTTANSVTYLCYHLAKNQDVQEKLADEIRTFIHEDEQITMHTVQNMEYLDWCVKEGLRVNPHATGALQRRCTETTTVGKENKLQIEKGVCVATNTYSIHFNEEIWGDPERFRPERFSREESASRHPLAWQPFGAGPRICVGMRFAVMEIKFAIIHVLRRFELRVCEETELNCTGNITVAPQHLKLRLEKR